MSWVLQAILAVFPLKYNSVFYRLIGSRIPTPARQRYFSINDMARIEQVVDEQLDAAQLRTEPVSRKLQFFGIVLMPDLI